MHRGPRLSLHNATTQTANTTDLDLAMRRRTEPKTLPRFSPSAAKRSTVNRGESIAACRAPGAASPRPCNRARDSRDRRLPADRTELISQHCGWAFAPAPAMGRRLHPFAVDLMQASAYMDAFVGINSGDRLACRLLPSGPHQTLLNTALVQKRQEMRRSRNPGPERCPKVLETTMPDTFVLILGAWHGVLTTISAPHRCPPRERAQTRTSRTPCAKRRREVSTKD
jgi:hypothetical protein